ncbi:MAG: hypothetical protein JST52_02950 [Bacteroidetes bacterium]|nr:hypothetical protein [Bacteroidota bacterium]MBS1739936.1 hypothetical protein [Bacteroidota bacterium]
MKVPCLVLHHIHPVLGPDFENNLTPPAPTPIPYTPYFAVSILSGNLIQSKYSKKTFSIASGISVMQRDTTVGMLGLPHFGNPANVFYPIILSLTTKSKSNFGSASTKVEGASLAAACLVVTNLNLNCGTISTPTGFVIPPSTFFVGLSPGDYLAGAFSIAFDMVLDYAFNKLMATNGMETGLNSLGARVIGRVWGTKYLSRLLPDSLINAHNLVTGIIGELFKMGTGNWMEMGTGVARGDASNPTGPSDALENYVRNTEWWKSNLES